ALAAFSRLRMHLISAYGMDPGPELQELHQRVLAGDPTLVLRPDPDRQALPDGPDPRPPACAEPRSWQPMCQLPRAVADFTGRAAELARLRNLLAGEGTPIAVVTGMLGTGKTALAVHAAHEAKAAFP